MVCACRGRASKIEAVGSAVASAGPIVLPALDALRKICYLTSQGGWMMSMAVSGNRGRRMFCGRRSDRDQDQETGRAGNREKLSSNLRNVNSGAPGALPCPDICLN